MTLCATERDVAGLAPFDPAFDTWFCEAEAARAAVLAAADAVVKAHAATATDRPFVAVAQCFEAMLLTDDAASYAVTANALMHQSWSYDVRDRCGRAAGVTVLLQEFRHHFNILMSLPDYAPITSLVQNDELELAA